MSRHRNRPKADSKFKPTLNKKSKPSNRYKSKVNKNVTGQVRIIGGRFKRQYIPFVEADGLRPSPDRLRETLFNWIQFNLLDAKVLDLCAGSGVLGFETISRGAKHVTFIEKQDKQADLIAQSAQKLKLDNNQYTIYNADALQVLPTLANTTNINNHQTHYHLVFIDPPYDLNLWIPLLNNLIDYNLISNNTYIYIEDKKPICKTLKGFEHSFNVLKQVKMGQIYAYLLSIDI